MPIFAIQVLTNCTKELIVFALYGDGAAGSRPAGFVASIFSKR